jgi:lysozyme
MRLSTQARRTLQRLEGFRPKAYIPVPNDKITIGYGFTEGVRMGDTMTREQADVRLIGELIGYEMAVEKACTNPPNQNEFDACVLLCFNIGSGAFQKSTVLKCHNRGDHQSAARAFGLWNKSSGVVYAGLTRRRAEESALYLTPVADDVSDPAVTAEMPQRVDAEMPAWKIQSMRADAKELEHVQQTLRATQLAAQNAARLSQQLADAQNSAAVRERSLRADAAASRVALIGLSAATGSALRSAKTDHATCIVASTALGDVLETVSTERRELSEKADRHVSDIRTLIDSWPK